MLRQIVTLALALAGLAAGGPRPMSAGTLRAPRRPLGSTITVDTLSDSNSHDNEISLREAIRIAGGDFDCFTDHEKGQISGASFVVSNPLDCGLNRWTLNIISPGVGFNFADNIVFSAGAGTINLNTGLPPLRPNDNINGNVAGSKVVINGGGANANGITVEAPSCSTCGSVGNKLQDLIITNFLGHGVATADEYPNGMILRGLEIHNVGKSCVYLNGTIQSNAVNNQIGGTGAGEGNWLYDCGEDGITINNGAGFGSGGQSNVIEGNSIGVIGPAGTVAHGNGRNGIYLINAAGTRVGGDTTASRNIIVGNTDDGIKIQGSVANGCTVFNNYVGLTGGGSVVLGNGASGVALVSGAGASGEANQIGGLFKSNIIVGNTFGIYIGNPGTDANVITNNTIGSLGGTAMPNGTGIRVTDGAKGTVIGGGASNAGNFIGGNTGDGIVVDGTGTSGTQIVGNGIGGSNTVLVTFSQNGGNGIQVSSPSTSTLISANLITYNAGHGVRISGAATNGNQVLSNYIGRLETGLPPFLIAYSNGLDGVRIEGGSDNNQIGLPGQGNTISGNGNDGVGLKDSGTLGNKVQANVIGLTLDLQTKRGNGASGIGITGNANGNVIGGSRALNEGNTISGNGTFGIYINGVTNTVTGNWIGTTPAYTTTLGNGSGGVMLDTSATNTVGLTTSLNFANIIGGNGGPGIDILVGTSIRNKVLGNRIGTDLNGFGAIPNTEGIVIRQGANLNLVDSNLISGNTGNGVTISDAGTDSNDVLRNTIGVDSSGALRLSNALNGVLVRNGAQSNRIGTQGKGNLISGNTLDGVRLDGTGTQSNYVLSNTIGTNLAGTAAISNVAFGIQLSGGASANYIGWDIANTIGNLISGNGSDGIELDGSATTGNYVFANVVGLTRAQTGRIPNGASGIAMVGGAHFNQIGWPIAPGEGGNVIAGNNGSGVFIADPGTFGNYLYANVIGTNRFSASGLGNGGAGVGIYNGAMTNTIGGDRYSDYGNLISGNGGPGVDLANSGTRANVIAGNLIGTDLSSNVARPNGIGIRMYGGAYSNTVGGAAPGLGNVLSGNASHGIGLYNSGTMSNVIVGNYIGTNLTITVRVPNQSHGIVIQEAASSNVITYNWISGNNGDGVNVNGSGTRFNRIAGNKIGTDLAGLLVLTNLGNGVHIADLALQNIVGGAPNAKERNVISGNGLAGVLIDGLASSNTVLANRIGTDINGMTAVPNQGAGIALVGAGSNNLCDGWPPDSLLISGNAGPGVLISGGAYNIINGGCLVGVGADGISPIGNGLAARQSGISLTNTSSNVVGSFLIANNGGAGIAVVGNSTANLLVPSIVRSNGGLAIDLKADGPTANDPGDADTGPNTLLNYPVVTARAGNTITGTACSQCGVTVYQANASTWRPGASISRLTSAQAGVDGVFTVTLQPNVALNGWRITLQAHQPLGNGFFNSSELSPWWGTYAPLIRR